MDEANENFSVIREEPQELNENASDNDDKDDNDEYEGCITC